MSNDKNNLSLVDTTSITHLINELRVLDTRILNRLSSADGVIAQLNETITLLSSKNNLNKALIQKEERIKIDAEYAIKEISDNLKYLEEILNKLTNFESMQERLLSQQFEKIKDFNIDLNAKADLYEKEIISLKDSILLEMKKQVEDLKNQINFKIVNIDIKNLEMINQNASKAVNNITAVAEWSKNVYHINILLVGILCLIGGGAIMALVFFFFK